MQTLCNYNIKVAVIKNPLAGLVVLSCFSYCFQFKMTKFENILRRGLIHFFRIHIILCYGYWLGLLIVILTRTNHLTYIAIKLAYMARLGEQSIQDTRYLICLSCVQIHTFRTIHTHIYIYIYIYICLYMGVYYTFVKRTQQLSSVTPDSNSRPSDLVPNHLYTLRMYGG